MNPKERRIFSTHTLEKNKVVALFAKTGLNTLTSVNTATLSKITEAWQYSNRVCIFFKKQLIL